MLHGKLSGFTPAAERTVQWCRVLLPHAVSADDQAALLILALLHDESLASACLRDFGISVEWLRSRQTWPAVAAMSDSELPERFESEGSGCGPQRSLTLEDDPADFQFILQRAKELARRETSDHAITSSVLLLAVVDQNPLIAEQLSAAGATRDAIRSRLFPAQPQLTERLAVEEPLCWNSGESVIQQPNFPVIAPQSSPRLDAADMPHILRAIDASLNRSREGMRVLEDCARFVCNDQPLCAELKSLRHDLAAAEIRLRSILATEIGSNSLLLSRDTPGDVGTVLTEATERSRGSITELALANSRRVQESLRSLEEFGKLLNAEFAAVMKQLRYRTYTVEQSFSGLMATVSTNARSRLQHSHIYVLITESQCRLPWLETAELALQGGADILQLREKQITDRELLQRAEQLVAMCRRYKALCIINDRPDIALATDADGVHVGQDELPVQTIRKLKGWNGLVGVSTHTPEQLQAAFAAGADYTGVGPVFHSSTKGFSDFPGLQYVQQAAEVADRPWFAIGGISSERLTELRTAGATRIAVTAAVTQAADPAAAVRELRQRLT